MVHPTLRIAHGYGLILLEMMVEARGRADQHVGEVWTPCTLKEVGLRGCGIARPDPQQIQSVGDGNALLPEQDWRVTVGSLMHFSASVRYYLLMNVLRRYALAGSALCRAVGHAFPHRTLSQYQHCLLL
jgi:hypothetical protein